MMHMGLGDACSIWHKVEKKCRCKSSNSLDREACKVCQQHMKQTHTSAMLAVLERHNRRSCNSFVSYGHALKIG
jgi:hypothetical protein